jgi:hypothetical protein
LAAGYPISAPKLLSFYEKHRDDICAVSVDCGKLDYISSAGLRVIPPRLDTRSGAVVSRYTHLFMCYNG